jgi:hypothetical protein
MLLFCSSTPPSSTHVVVSAEFSAFLATQGRFGSMNETAVAFGNAPSASSVETLESEG